MAKHYRLLSYPLSIDTYNYGGSRPFAVKAKRSLLKGDSCNTFILNVPNHLGTHIDCPNHFYARGKKLCQYGIEDFIFSRPVVLECKKSANGLVDENDIKRAFKKLKKADLLLLRTGFHKYKRKSLYGTRNPGISPGAAKFIRARLKNIRCIGIDSISVSPYKNRELGRETHEIFLKAGPKGDPVCLIEDMDLSENLNGLKEVFVSPLFIEDVDSAPCTVWGVF
ncbi:cyclase family protein [Candidatus Omnitrophota bacterium]